MIEKTRWYQRHAFGSPWDKGLLKVSFGYTHTFKKVAAASDTAVMAAVATATTARTIVDGITDPDVPRVLKVKPGGTAGDLGSNIVVITGTNVEGKTITDSFQLVDGNTTAIEGTKVFKTVTSVAIPVCDGTGATISVGYVNKLGLNHRLWATQTTVREVKDTGSSRTLTASAPTVNASDHTIESNYVTPATTPNGTYFYTFYYVYDKWSVDDLKDDPVYITSTSTSSTSTSSTTTSVSTSTSMTTTSSTSTSTTSISTSTTSTSTTTVP